MESTVSSEATGRPAVQVWLREAITSGEFVPGQRLIEADLVSLLGVSRNVVRLALDALVADGLVERIPNRGARVRRVSTAEAVAITECRMALEGLIAAKAAQHATDAEIAELHAGVRRMREAVRAGELVRYSALIHELHQLIRQAARQPTAAALIERLQAQIVRHQFRLSLRPGRPQVSLAGLTAVVSAIAARDPEAAEMAARTHLSSVITALSEKGA
ncbi:GntR family transcriptional regulator [Micromonospora sp. NPDC006766]|uniref:GntR family transcriptional regulator n=1 Tax=Micromonospora sp. NPDC006766 TaxID=3154778 RepID=UPI0033FC735D